MKESWATGDTFFLKNDTARTDEVSTINESVQMMKIDVTFIEASHEF